MKQKEKTTKTALVQAEQNEAAVTHMTQDLKNSILIVSVTANLFVFTGWIALQVTSQFDAQFANFLFK